MSPQSFQLVMRSGPNPGKTFPLEKSEITIGRDSMNDIVINDAEVSRKHARLLLQPGGYMLEDLGSTNGTFIEGQRLLGPHSLRPGELIQFGETVTLNFESVESADYDPDATYVSSPATEFSSPAGLQEAEEPLPASPSLEHQSPSEPPPAPAYSGQIPSGPGVYEGPPVVPSQRRSSRNWILAGCGCLLLTLCFCVIIIFIIDAQNLWCAPLLRPITNVVFDLLNPFLDGALACP
jgi:predicted component of type VI protein secretion system